MTAREISAAELGLPRFAARAKDGARVFDLDSHARAREALELGLAVAGRGFNIFVVGEDRAARMTATLAYLREVAAKRPPSDDWLYLNNFRYPDHPTPMTLPAGTGRRFRDAMASTITRLREALAVALTAEAYQARLLALREQAQGEVAGDIDGLAQTAQAHGLQLTQGDAGALRLMRAPPAPGAAAPAPIDPATEREMAAALTRVQLHTVTVRGQLAAHIVELNRGVVAEVASPLLDAVTKEFGDFAGLIHWLTEFRVDIIDNADRFQIQLGAANEAEIPERRYGVNLLVDHGDDPHPRIVLESNPTYENLFGWIEYRQTQGALQTDFLEIRAGALHYANGGVLVLRAEALAANPASWAFLKAALRDGEIRIEEPSRAQMTHVAGAPRPRPIPLNLKVVVVGAPRWYATFFDGDPDFRVYFKVNADIEAEMAANPANLDVYAGLIVEMARRQGLDGASDGAITRLLGVAARWAEQRDRLSARVELIDDLVCEAALADRAAHRRVLSEAAVAATYETRRGRNALPEDRLLRVIVEGALMIDTTGGAIGQINGLTVHNVGDHQFGTPVRITARAHAGRAGVVNIERDVALGGPIQQKGAMVLAGFLASCLAQHQPLSFTCSITFEQVYGGVEGDSASMAELIAVLSELAQLPIRQDIAITGSVNQAGRSQAIGGGHWKIEGFHRVCAAKPGGLTGTQGVLVPDSNRINLVLHDDVATDIAAGRFHIWSATNVAEVAELLMGVPMGQPDAAGVYPPDTILGRVAARLQAFERILAGTKDYVIRA